MKITPIISPYNNFDYQTKKLPSFEGRDSDKTNYAKIPLQTLQALFLAAALTLSACGGSGESKKTDANGNEISVNTNTTFRIPQVETSPNAMVKYGNKQMKASELQRTGRNAAQADYKKEFKDVKNLNANEIRRPLPCIDSKGNIVAQVINYSPTNTKGPLKGKLIIVNSGHGGYNPKTGIFDPGTFAVDENSKVIEEWYKAQNFSEKLITELSAQGAQVVYINGNASSVMRAKAETMKKLPKGVKDVLFISLHCDASKDKNKKGQSVLYYDNNDLKLANVIKNNLTTMQEISPATFETNQRTNLGVLKTTTEIPSILIELGFQSNENDNKNIDWQGFQSATGKLIAQGILQYFNPELTIPTSVSAKDDFSVNGINSKDFPIPGGKSAAVTPSDIASEINQSAITKIRHAVQAKETLYSISQKYQTTPESIANANGIKNNNITLGQVLEFDGIAPAGYVPASSETINTISDIEKKQQILNEKMIEFKPFISQAAKKTGFSESYLNYLVRIEIGHEEDINNIYKDKNENETIGVGHLVTRADVTSGRFKNGLNNKQMFDLLAEDLLETERLIKSSIGEANYKKMNFRQKEALVDFVFNRGIGTLTRKSPKLMQAIKDGNWEEFTANLDYVYSGKKVMSGLCKRRLWEMYRSCNGNVTPRILESAQKVYEAGYNAAIQEEKERKTSITPGYNKEVEQIFGGKIKLK